MRREARGAGQEVTGAKVAGYINQRLAPLGMAGARDYRCKGCGLQAGAHSGAPLRRLHIARLGPRKSGFLTPNP